MKNASTLLLLAATVIFQLGTISVVGTAVAQVHDPLEDVNRAIFTFNDTLDVYILEPVASGYEEYVPKPIQHRVHDFFQNLRSPIYVVSDLVQLKFAQAGNHTGRFIINSTIGGLGLVDVAKTFGMPHESEDFGTALGYHGVGEGPYLVLPLLGPSNCRDLFGRIIDYFLNPMNYAGDAFGDGDEIAIGANVVEGVDTRAGLLEAVESAKEASVDYYSFVKNSYHQHRQNLIFDNDPPEEDTDADIAEE